MRSPRHNNPNADELKSEILRLSPITCCELWYFLNELRTWECAKLRPHFQHDLGNVVIGVLPIESHRAPIVVCMSHCSSRQYNVTSNYISFATEDHISHVNETSVSAQAWDIVHRVGFTTSSTYSCTHLVTVLRLIGGYLGFTVLMKSVKHGRSPRCSSRFSHACIIAMAFTHCLNRGFFDPIAWFFAEHN